MIHRDTRRFIQAAVFLILLFAMMICASSCSSHRKANRGIRKLEKLKDRYADVWEEVSKKAVRIDTVIQEVQIPGEVQVVVDSSSIDSLVAELNFMIANPQVDTVKGDVVRETITRYVPRLFSIDSVEVDTLGIKFSLYYDKDKAALDYTITRDSIAISKEENVEVINPVQYITINKIPWWIYVIMGVLVLVVLRLTFKK